MSFTTSLNFGKYKVFLKSLTEEQKQLVNSCKFGPLLDFDCSEAPKYVAYMLATKFDVKTRTVRFDNGSSFAINAFTVHQILGIPIGGRMVDTKPSKAVKGMVHSNIINGSVAPSTDYLISLVNKDLRGDKFTRVFMLITLTIFLCPTSCDRASMHYYSGIAVVEDIPKHDWCSLVLDRLVQAIDNFQTSLTGGLATGKQKKSSLGGCLYVLVVTYFEYIKTTDIQPRHGTPRIKYWDDYMIQQYLSLDGNSDDGHQFGMLQIKDPCETPFTEPLPPVDDSTANQTPAAENSNSKDPTGRPSVPPLFSDTVFSKLPPSVEEFISNLIPADEHGHVRAHLMDMCTNFHKELMSSCLAAMQPVLIKQLCNMVEIMWASLCKGANHGDDFSKQADILGDMPGCSRRTVFGDGARGSTTLVDIGACAQADACQPKNTPPIDNNAVSSSCGTIQCAQKFRNRYCDSSSRDTTCAPPCNACPPSISAMGIGEKSIIPTNPNVKLEEEIFHSNSARTPLVNFTSNDRHPSYEIVPDSLDQSCNRDSKLLTQRGPSRFMREELASVNTAPLKRRRLCRISHDSTKLAQKRMGTEAVTSCTAKPLELGTHKMSMGVTETNMVLYADGGKPQAIMVSNETSCGGTPVISHSYAGQYMGPPKFDTSCEVEETDQCQRTFDANAPIYDTSPDQDVQDVKNNKLGKVAGTHKSTVVSNPIDISSDDDAVDIAPGKFTSKHSIHMSICSAALASWDYFGVSTQEVHVSESERDLYKFVTKRLTNTDISEPIARIGEVEVDHRLFGDSFRARKRMSSFVMDVFCEALNLDYKEHADVEPSKFFLTSYAVERLESPGVQVHHIARLLSSDITATVLNSFNMIMIPVCKGGHWWLIVANLRDQRFDVLNSTPMTPTSSSVTQQIRDNFGNAYKHLFKDSSIDTFRIQVQPAPQQDNNHDCGIFTMKFMQLWDGNGSSLDNLTQRDMNLHRQKIANYILRHKHNVKTIDDVRKFVRDND